jgi:Domain of unknown function (DUF4926)
MIGMIRSTWIVRAGELAADHPWFIYYRKIHHGRNEMHWVVAVVEDLPAGGQRLVQDQIGTVVEDGAPGVYEVEFPDDNGRTYALVELKAEQLMRLHHQPVHETA